MEPSPETDSGSIDWATLQCAYGSAERVPELLRRAEGAGPESEEAWDDLWSHLCHQGTVYSASYAALASLTAMCLRQEPRGSPYFPGSATVRAAPAAEAVRGDAR